MPLFLEQDFMNFMNLDSLLYDLNVWFLGYLRFEILKLEGIEVKQMGVKQELKRSWSLINDHSSQVT